MSLVRLIRFEPRSDLGMGAQCTEDERALMEIKLREYQRGHQEGYAEMEQKHRTGTEAKAQMIVSRIDELYVQIGAIEDQIQDQAGDLAAAAINSVLPNLASQGMAGEMALAVRELIGRLEPPHLRIAGPGALIDAIRAELDRESRTASVPLEFDVDDTAGSGSVKLEWPQGSADFDHGEVLMRVTRSLDELMTGHRPPAAPGNSDGVQK